MSRALVLGVGNPARGDDGLGPAVADLAERDARFCGAEVRRVMQLTPELAADVAAASVVVVVDARAGEPPGHIAWAPVEPPTGPGIFSHHLTPGALVALAAFAYEQAPPMFVVGVGARDFEAGAPLSDAVAAALPGAVDAVAGLLRERSRPGTGRGASAAR